MNIKLIDFAAQTYERSSDEQARACVALFRPVWAAQARVADEARRALDGQVAAGAWSIPAENDLDRWYWEGTPLLSQAPVDLAAARIAAAARDVAQALADGGVLNPADAQALASCDWDRLVASTPTELAGCRPADYLDACAEAAEAACGERGRAALLVLALALRPLLDPAAEALLSAVRGRVEGEGAHHAKPRTCPVCGGQAALAYIGPTGSGKPNGRTLYCAQCGATWEFERVRCARCGEQNQEHLHYKSIEGDDVHRLHLCDECHGYLRTFFVQDNALQPFAPEVEDAVMAKLDAVAARLRA